jgi:putative membrane protein
MAMMWGWGGMAWGGWIFMALFWVVLIGLIVWAVAGLFPAGRRQDEQPRQTPEEILDLRLARGEVSIEDYQEMRAELRGRSGVRG